MRHPTEDGDDQEVLLGALGRLWCAGVAVDWDGYFAGETRRRVGLPTYPFERRRYWVEAPGRAAAGAAAASDLGEQAPGGGGTPTRPAAMSLHERPDLSTVYAEPRSEVERAVAGVWERLLGIGGVGAFDDFFELGGHSLLATQVLSRVRDAFQVELPLKALFDAPTVAGLAAAVDAARAAAGAAGSIDVPPPLVPVERSGDLPLSFAQQRLWFLSRLDPGGDAYNVPVAVRLSGDLDVLALERTFAAIVARHEVLRTTFAERDGEPVQVVSPPPAGPAALPRVDLTALPEDARRAAVERHARAEAHRPFDLAAGPLLRVTLLAEAPHEHVALVVMHHIVTDGWSMGLLVREIGELYTAFVTGRDAVLPALPVQYADYAAWQRRWLAGEVLERKVAWWRETLGEDPPPAELAVDRPRTAARTWAGGSFGFTFAPETAERLARFGRDSGATVFMTLLAAWAGLLSRATGQEDVRVGTPVAGRNRSEVESLIGFFVNTLVLRADLSGGPSFAALVARVREASLAAHEHQDVPFERLVEELVRERNLAVTPLFQVFFVVQNAPGGRLELPELTLAALPAEGRSAKFDLSLQVEERTRGLTATLEYAADLFDAGTAERMAGHLQRLLDAALAEPDRPLAELPLATAAERRQLVAGWNDTAAPVPPGSLHALVERRAAAAPRAPAVVAGDVVWSYADLDRRAAAVAARLAAAGVGREDRVALLAERSPEALAGLLGTLKAGAAFVAVDPGTPAERLAFLLADS
ncbi:MAG TPA: condensation domain-containing protein, partial [Thermoanaerobaculia bacterium]|nr:condensation domain-containing protein [Thermoanaerobaculia bacterium]